MKKSYLRRLNKKHTLIFIIGVALVLAVPIYIFRPRTPEKTTTSKPKTKQEDNSVSLVAVGDNVIHENVYNYADDNLGVRGDGQYDFRPCYTNVKKYISGHDLSYLCQETILGGDDKGASGYPAFNTPSVIAENLKDTGFNVVSGATNHSMDMSQDGLFNACQVWRNTSDVTYVGTYDSQQDRDNIRIVEKKGIKFAFLSYTFAVNQYSNYKKIQAQLNNNPYMLGILDDDTITSEVAKAKEIADVVIVAAHWGLEGSNELNSLQKHYAQLFTDLGVDVVLGSHTHVIQPIEWKTNASGHKTLITYCLGNFISTMKEVETQLEIMVDMDFIKKDDSIEIDNITITPLVNHYSDQVCTVYRLKDYTAELASQHNVLKNETNIVEQFKNQIQTIYGDNFKINM